MKQIMKRTMKIPQTGHRAKGFTLIEILVVLVIISILAAILFPVFARARENARRASCQSNLKQIALSMRMYAQDNGDMLPAQTLAPSLSATPSVPSGWADALQPYLKNTQVLQCPDVKNPSDIGPASYPPFQGLPSPIISGYTDYWINYYAAGASIGTFRYPSETVLLGEGSPNSGTYGSGGCITGLPCNTSAGDAAGKAAIINGTGLTQHLGGANYAFVDGHVKWYNGIVVGTNSQSSVVMNGLTTHAQANGQPTLALG